MQKNRSRQKKVLPKLTGTSKRDHSSKGEQTSKDGQESIAQEKSRTQPISCPTIKGVVGEAISYYQSKSTLSGSQLNIFSVSFQGGNIQSNYDVRFQSKALIPRPLGKEQIIRFRYENCEKIGLKQGKPLDTSFLLGRFAQYRGPLRPRNTRPPYADIERINRSERMRQELMQRYASKGRKKQQKIQNPQSQSLALKKSSQLLSQQSTEKTQLISFGRQEQQRASQEKIRLKSVVIEDNKIRQNLKNTEDTVRSEGKERLYATRTNILSHSGHSKKGSIIKYPCISRKGYKFVTGPGNNSQLVQMVLEGRGNWSLTTEHDTLFHLRWEQYTEKTFYNRLNFGRYKQLVNHLVAHECISTKSGLLQTLKHFLQRFQANCRIRPEQWLQVFDVVPITFAFDWEIDGKLEEELKRFVFYYCENHPDPSRRLRKERDCVELIKQVGDKARHLNLTLNKSQLMRGNPLPPLTSPYCSTEQEYLWIFKPSELNRGRGIKIFSTLQDLGQMLREVGGSGEFVIQKYLERPMLVAGRKFDIRVWVLTDGEGRSYLFEEGYIRTSSEAYTLHQTHQDNQYVHLTNNAVQKNSHNYGLFQDANQLSFQSFDKLMDHPCGYFRQHFFPSIKDLCALVMQAGLKGQMLGHPPLKQSPAKERKNGDVGAPRSCHVARSTFEIFGFDYMIDAEQKLWLIEVNTNPCLETSSKLLESLIPRMVNDAFRKTLDPMFKPMNSISYPVEGYEDQLNLWEPLPSKTEELMEILKRTCPFLPEIQQPGPCLNLEQASED